MLQPRLGGRVRRPVGAGLARPRIGEKHRASGRRRHQQRRGGADDAQAGGEVHPNHLAPVVGQDVRHRRQLAERRGGVDHHVEPAEAVEQCRADHVDLIALQKIERQQRGRAASRADGVVRLLEAALGAGDADDVSAKAGEGNRRRRADAAAGARDERHAAFQRSGHRYRLSVSRLCWRSELSAMSGSGIG
jgi:hypothetical protein